MTNEEAIEILQDWIDRGFEYEDGYGIEALCDIEKEACELAIKALKENKSGEWIQDSDTLRCSNCGFGYFPTDYYFDKGQCISAGTDRFIFKVCPICGTQMEGQE